MPGQSRPGTAERKDDMVMMCVRRAWRRPLGVVVAVLGIALAACGTSTQAGPATGAGATYSPLAQQVADLAAGKLLYGPTSGVVDPAQLRAPQASDIKAVPFSAAGKNLKIAVVSCAAISPQCRHTSDITAAYLAELGIASQIFSSDYTPAGNQQAMNSALAYQPDAIIEYAVAPSTIGAQIAEAQSRRIPVIGGIATKATDGGNLDAYVPQGSNLYQIAAAAQMTVAGRGAVNVHWLNAPEFPQLEVGAGTAFLKTVCPGCGLSEGTETAAQVTNPVQMGQLVTSIMRANPDTTYLTLASACADLQSAAAALRQQQRGTLVAGGCGSSAIAAMNAGNLPFATGSVEPWTALASIDQALRLISGQPALPESETGPAAYLVTPQNTPDRGTTGDYGALDRWTVSLFDYVAPYSAAWGADLSGVVASEK
ncbi:hypothetical protein GCM10023175_05170 [Pseudonocardia xishanensis]|uniref:Periplasmic binding protein domain-containing protein n=1 Tax=Pseudonocardia xishanensis TaxID=630995 RepID=A0ABP8RF82_9PSEU